MKKKINADPSKYDMLFTVTKSGYALEEGAGENGPKRLRVEGKIQQIGKVNENKRSYPKPLWDRVLASESPFMKRLKSRQVLGVLEHPEKGGTKLSEVSHLMEDVWMEGEDVFGKILVLKTEPGKILEELFSVGVPVGVSSRANGDVKRLPNGVEEVLPEGFDLETFDFVYKPSVSDAYPTVVQESLAAEASKEKERKHTMDLKESIVLIKDSEDLVKKVQESDKMSVATLVECCANMQTSLSKLDGVEDSCKSEASVLKGKLLTVLPPLRAQLEKKVAESTSGSEVSGKASAEVIRRLLLKNKELGEANEKLQKEVTEATAKITDLTKSVTETSAKVETSTKEMTEAKAKLEADVKSLGEAKAKLESDVKALTDQKERAVGAVEKLLATKDRAVGVVESLLDQKDRAIDVVEDLLDQKDRAVEVIEKLLDTKDRSVLVVEQLLNKLDEKEAKLNNMYNVTKAVVERARILQRNAYLAKVFRDNPGLRQHEAKFEKCSTVVECQSLIKQLGAPIKESVGHDGNVASRRPSHIPVEGVKTVEESKGQKKGFIHLVAKKG